MDQPGHQMKKDQKAIAAGLVRNILEWYDFAVYGFFAPILARLFFPSDDPVTSLIAAYGAFAAGFLMRPLGAVIFDHIGDRLGRKRALTLSIILMAIPSLCIGLLPIRDHPFGSQACCTFAFRYLCVTLNVLRRMVRKTYKTDL